jgi:hypothetical protein
VTVVQVVNRGKSIKLWTLATALMAAAVTLTPPARAGMPIGNYEFVAPWDPAHSWVWLVACDSVGCPHVIALPRPLGGAASWTGTAQLAEGRYTMTAEVPTGRICLGYSLPSHDTYMWDNATLSGSVESSYESDCGGGPAGTISYPFSLVRM